MGRLHILLFATAIFAVGILVSGCESTEDNNIAEAQQCLDGLGESPSPTDAANCVQPIENDTSPDAEVVRCAADFIEGGITDSSLISAYEAVKNLSGASVAQSLIPALAQNTTTQAQNTYNDCTASDSPSLIYIAGLSQAGTLMVSVAGSPSSAASFCANPSNTANCSPSTIGTIAQTVASSYCNGANQSSDVCTTLSTAISQGNGDPNSIGTYLLQNL